ncbi:MAG: HDIG domain-containing metalloprotein [Candidatus Omnitrophota bacterium]
MSPLVKKTLFRIKKLKRPFKPNRSRSIISAKGFKRCILTALILFLAIGIIHMGKLPVRTMHSEGDVARDDIYAPFDFSFKAGIDEERTKARQQEAQDKVLDVYSVDPAVYKTAESTTEKIFNELLSLKVSGVDVTDEVIKGLRSNALILIEADKIKTLLKYPDITKLKETALLMLAGVYSQPIISNEAKKELLDSGRDKALMQQTAKNDKVIRNVSDIRDIAGSHEYVDPLLAKAEIEDSAILGILRQIIYNRIQPNFIRNNQATEAAKKQAASLVSPIYIMPERYKGEIIVRKGQRVTKDHIAQLDQVDALSSGDTVTSRLWGIFIIMCLLTFLMYIYLKLFEANIFKQDKLLLLIGFLILLVALLARIVVTYLPLPGYFIPIAAVSMLLTLLVGGTVAAIATMTAAIVAALIAGARFDIFLVAFIGGMSAICTVYGARHRSQLMKAGLYVGLLNAVTISSIGIISNLHFSIFLKQSLWGLGNGILSAGLAMAFLPLFESIFKLTTDLKLIELADLNHPLLKNMVMKAAGTYHHSLVVGNLAEAASDSVGANSLLARVGSYYHDIGKIQKAEYFAENKQDPGQMHDKLTPSMSSLIITNHVKDGIELAEKYKLGERIKDIIEQHHGKGLVTYFYHQAVEKNQQSADNKAQPEEVVSEESYRYPGPKPQTKESAIVMLADSVEAASRVLQNPAPQRLKELVRKIVNNKFIDRQLDECDLTLKDINNIADCFVRVLTGIYHSRVEYPEGKPGNRNGNNNKRAKRERPL